MAHLHKKMKKGRPYYYIREMARVNGKPKVINQIYLGSVERILGMATGERGGLGKIQVQEFGALWLANVLDSLLKNSLKYPIMPFQQGAHDERKQTAGATGHNVGGV
jgi:hypothetical protein